MAQTSRIVSRKVGREGPRGRIDVDFYGDMDPAAPPADLRRQEVPDSRGIRLLSNAALAPTDIDSLIVGNSLRIRIRNRKESDDDNDDGDDDNDDGDDDDDDDDDGDDHGHGHKPALDLDRHVHQYYLDKSAASAGSSPRFRDVVLPLRLPSHSGARQSWRSSDTLFGSAPTDTDTHTHKRTRATRK